MRYISSASKNLKKKSLKPLIFLMVGKGLFCVPYFLFVILGNQMEIALLGAGIAAAVFGIRIFGGDGSGGSEGSQVIRVCSFNILADVWAVDSAKGTVKERIKKQIAYILETNPDVLLLQETTPGVLAQYERLLADYKVYDCFAAMKWQPAKPNTPLNGNGVLCKRDLFLHGSSKCFVVEIDKKHGNYGSLVTGTTTRGLKLKILNVHLEYSSVKIAKKQFDSLFGPKRPIKDADAMVIIGGDFNMGLKEFRDQMIKKGFESCTPNVKLGTNTYVPVNGGKLQEGSVPDDYREIIDQIITKGGKCLPKEDEGCQDMSMCLSKYGSDHYPIFADISFPL